MLSVTDYQPRLIDDMITALLGELPALFLTGPRATGKTTTALRHAKTVVRLDRAAGAVAFRADPDAAMRGLVEPILRLSEEARVHWLESYVEHLLTRDAEQIDGGRDPVRLRRYLEAYALNTAGTVRDSTLLESSGINRKTAQAYERLLTNLLVVESIPAWTSNRLKRLSLSPKRYVLDPSIAASVLGLDVDLVMRDGDLLGRLLDTFVTSQLRAELPITRARPRLYHLRQREGRLEIDVLAELAGGRIVGLEVRADASPDAGSARHLAALRDRYPDRFLTGIVLHAGPYTYPLRERLVAAPISSLWA
ncbi:MAG: DUF4143 domain-containing protein [Chloroflexota bacterium]|nr:DUF4143 domain-containing protein [Chloroflexota bacterium]